MLGTTLYLDRRQFYNKHMKSLFDDSVGSAVGGWRGGHGGSAAVGDRERPHPMVKSRGKCSSASCTSVAGEAVGDACFTTYTTRGKKPVRFIKKKKLIQKRTLKK